MRSDAVRVMSTMSGELEAAIAGIAGDADSSASALLPAAVAVLDSARALGFPVLGEAVRALCAAQPCMGAIWNAAAIAVTHVDDGKALGRFAVRAARAPAAIARLVVQLIVEDQTQSRREPLRFVTCSASGAVRAALEALAARCSIVVACAEGRPRYEGRSMAAALTRAGLAVELFTDAGIGTAVRGAAAVLVGADAVAGKWFVNKCGTQALAAVAAATRTPTYVLAGFEKLVCSELASKLSLREGPPEEVWDSPQIDSLVRNPYFEKISFDTVSAVVTDIGLLDADSIGDACESQRRHMKAARLLELLAG